jgi:hypothetical protein
VKRKFYIAISRVKGSASNSLGDGPSTQEIRNLCIQSCGIYGIISPNHGVPIVAYASDHSKVGFIIREINGINVLEHPISQDDLVSHLLSINCRVNLMSRELFLTLNSRSSTNLSSTTQSNEHLFRSRYNSIGIIASTSDQGRRSKWHDHAIITETSHEFQRRTGFGAGDIISKIGMFDTSKLTNCFLQQLLNQNHEVASYHFIHQEKYLRIQKRNHSFFKIPQEWDYEKPCQHCGCIYLKSILQQHRTHCCLKGVACNPNKFPSIGEMPTALAFLTYERLEHMSKKSSFYNGVLALGATAIDNGTGGGWERIVGDHAVKLHGRTYHFLPATGGCGGLEHFTFNAHETRTHHIESLGENICRYLKTIFHELKLTNSLVQECEQIGEFATRSMVNEGHVRELMVSINQKTSHFDIAAVTSLHCTGNRILKYQLKGQAESSSIPVTHELLEPLCYPIFFPWGSGGWGSDTPHSFTDYLRCRLLMPDVIEREYDDDEHFVNHDERWIPKKIFNKSHTQLIPVNRFQCLAQLGQMYFTDMVSRNIDQRLNWVRRNQHVIMGPNGRQRSHEDDPIGETGEESFLSQSFHGSRRHLRKLSTNALTIVSEFNKPTLFVTLTCNPLWPEIQKQLLPGQCAFNRPDIVCPVFHERLRAFLKNMREGKYFDDLDEDGDVVVRRIVIYELRVIEYQHRGLPHAHIVFKFGNIPDSDHPDLCLQWIDQHISCQLPIVNEFSSQSDRNYATLVEKHMTHTCSNAVNGCKDERGHCKKGFMDTTTRRSSSFDERGYVQYKRRQEDLRIVQHNRKILEDWDGHAHVDWCGSTYTVLYLYKYLYKGAQKVKFRLQNADDIEDKDEISLYIRGRYLCSMDAVWRILGYQVLPTIDRVKLIVFVDISCPQTFCHINQGKVT